MQISFQDKFLPVIFYDDINNKCWDQLFYFYSCVGPKQNLKTLIQFCKVLWSESNKVFFKKVYERQMTIQRAEHDRIFQYIYMDYNSMHCRGWFNLSNITLNKEPFKNMTFASRTQEHKSHVCIVKTM